MLKRLVQNTVVSALVFGGVAVLGVVVIPIIIRTWGVTEFGLIVLARLLLPNGLVGIIDFGLPEVTTQVVARAREHRNWAVAGSQLLLLTIVSVLLAATLSALTWFAIPVIVAQFKIEAAHVDSFTEILRYTAVANLLLFPALVWEGIVKGFERYSLLRLTEFLSTASYVAATVYAAHSGQSYEVVAYCFLGSNILRALILLGAAAAAFIHSGATLSLPAPDVRHDVMTRCVLVMQGKLIGGIIAPIQPFLIGIYLGPQSVGIYDTLIRIPRLVKVVASLLTSALLPVVSRLDQRVNTEQFNRVGEVGIALLPMVTVPPMAAAAILSRHHAGLDWCSDRALRSLDGRDVRGHDCISVRHFRQRTVYDPDQGSGPAQPADAGSPHGLGYPHVRNDPPVCRARFHSRPGDRNSRDCALAALDICQGTRNRSKEVFRSDRYSPRDPAAGGNGPVGIPAF
jgi:O-antigen/teichoic acid export membrane protein